MTFGSELPVQEILRFRTSGRRKASADQEEEETGNGNDGRLEFEKK
jgi:hypothetical protein